MVNLQKSLLLYKGPCEIQSCVANEEVQSLGRQSTHGSFVSMIPPVMVPGLSIQQLILGMLDPIPSQLLLQQGSSEWLAALQRLPLVLPSRSACWDHGSAVAGAV